MSDELLPGLEACVGGGGLSVLQRLRYICLFLPDIVLSRLLIHFLICPR
jgi:hypothetical protein